ncbi:hypothetical protein H4219_002894 [Mycoemilia scoparia]|uniref:Cytochrome P450 n=1 Tax=Mycoemilia scoparia TaxID=417184 RepID=A0A9W8A2W4_9FUNG|nr:hypothetical protein H4219_002894 [Mycoemilia scoparia]
MLDISILPVCIGILTALLTSLGWWALSPPAELRHIPSVSTLKFMWYFISNKTREELHRDVFEPALKASGVAKVWFLGAWIVMFSEPELVKKVLVDINTFQKYNIGERMKGTIDYDFFGNSFFFMNGQEWRHQRQIVNPAFHRSWDTTKVGIVAKDLIEFLEKSKKEPIEVVTLMHRTALDALGRIAFDFDFGAIRDPTNPYYRLYMDIMDIMRIPIRRFFPQLDKFPFPYVKRGIKKMAEFDEIIYKMVNKKLKEALKRKELGISLNMEDRSKLDLLTLMIEAKVHTNSDSTDKQFRDNLMLFYIGGHDTTSNSMSFILMELARNQEIQELARKEATEVLGDEPKDIVPTPEQLKSLKYIDQIIKENQRKNPIMSMVSREVAKPVEIGGCVLKPGVMAGVYMYGVQHNPKYYKDPETFDPDRFGPNPNPDKYNRVPFSWVPFGGGARQCMGMNFSMVEQQVFISMLVRKFKWSLPENSPFLRGQKTGHFEVCYPKDLEIIFEPIY